MAIKPFVFALLIAVTASAQTARLSDASYLRKLSFHLRGMPPEASEYQELKLAEQNQTVEAFFKARIHNYQTSILGQVKMGLRLQEAFKLKTSSVMPGVTGLQFQQEPLAWFSALDELFLSLTRDNLSWDELLTAKKYELYRYMPQFGGGSGMTDFDFMRGLLPQVLPPPEAPYTPDPTKPIPAPKPFEYSFDASDVRIGGALTTARFFNRYATTEINKNRRRAAAVFNIFLCDSMAATVKDPPSSPDSGLDKAFPDTSLITEHDIEAVVKAGDQHGSDKE